MMDDYCLILECTPKAGFKDGSSNHFKQLASYLNGSKLELGTRQEATVHIFNAAKQKTNCYNAKPKRLSLS